MANQAWAKIGISLKTEYSKSLDRVGAVFIESETAISYQHSNGSKSSLMDTMHNHKYKARLVPLVSLLEGEYYTGRNKESHSRLTFQPKPSRLSY